MTNKEKLLLHYMLLAPTSEIDAMVPSTVRECAEILHIPQESYSNSIHYVKIVAKMRKYWAQAVMDAVLGEAK